MPHFNLKRTVHHKYESPSNLGWNDHYSQPSWKSQAAKWNDSYKKTICLPFFLFLSVSSSLSLSVSFFLSVSYSFSSSPSLSFSQSPQWHHSTTAARFVFRCSNKKLAFNHGRRPFSLFLFHDHNGQEWQFLKYKLRAGRCGLVYRAHRSGDIDRGFKPRPLLSGIFSWLSSSFS